MAAPDDLNIAPSRRYYQVSPSADDLIPYPRAVYVGDTGDVTGEDFFGNTTTFTNVQAGSLLPVAFKTITAAPPGTIALV